MLEQVGGNIASVTADGTYDGGPSYEAVTSYHADPSPIVVIPLRTTAVPRKTGGTKPTQRNRHIQLIREKSRMARQKETNYDRRNLVETGIGRYKSLIGSKVRARSFANQKGEAAIAIRVLNRMVRTAKLISVRVA